MKVSYLDAGFELDHDQLLCAPVNTLVGWEVPSRFRGMTAFASEFVPAIGGYRGITHVPTSTILMKEEL